MRSLSKGMSAISGLPLYDLLANAALEYFENDERDIRKPAYAFEIKDAAAFADAAQFAAAKFTTRDSISLHHKALLDLSTAALLS